MSAYRFEPSLTRGTMLKRKSQFTALVNVDGEEIVAYIPTTNRIGDVENKDLPCLLSFHDDPKRKLKYDIEAVLLSDDDTDLKGDAAAFLSRMQGHASNMADVDFPKNSMFLHGIDGAKRFLSEQGFNVKSESVDRYIPDIPGVDADLMRELREAYKVMDIFTMTVAEKTQKTVDKDRPFAVESSCADGVFTASVQGRMDTITAPELLNKFQEAGSGIKEIRIDVSRMAYVSLAGLRGLLMMYKSLEDRSRFRMTGISEDVREILETNGFDQFLL